MRLQTRLILVFLFLAMIPLAISGGIIVRILDTEVTSHKSVFRHERLGALANRMDWNLKQVSLGLRMGLETFDLQALSVEERVGVLRILFNQRSYLNAIQLIDAQGRAMSPPVFLSDPRALTGAFAGHVAVQPEELKVLYSPELLQAATQSTERQAYGLPLQLKSAKEYQVPMAMAFYRQNELLFYAVALMSCVGSSGAQEAFLELVESRVQEGSRVVLVDARERTLLEVPPLQEGATGLALPKELADVTRSGAGQLEYSDGPISYVVAWDQVAAVGWRVLTLQQAQVVYRSVRASKRDIYYWLWVSIIIAVVFGAYFSRTLSTPIQQLAAKVLEVARGNLDARVPVRSRDEIGELAETFNYMAGELKAQKQEIERQSEEIRSWNRELQARVEARTRELKEAQGFLVHTQKLAAVAELGSGVAHELNNPLAAILGFAQILIARNTREGPDGTPVESQDLKILQRIEEQTQRCRDIVHHLLRFSQEQVDRGAYDSVDVAEVVGTVLKLFEGSFASKKIRISNALTAGNMITWGNRAQLLQAFLQMFSAVRPIMSAGQELVITGRKEGKTVELVVTGPLHALEGSGSDPFVVHSGQDQAMAQALGLWVARGILQEHQGTLAVELPEGKEDAHARLVVSLPLASGGRPVGKAEPA